MKEILFIITLLIAISASAADRCAGKRLAEVLDTLLDVASLHNCTVEVTATTVDKPLINDIYETYRSYVVWLRDEYRCSHGFSCPVTNFELSVPIDCEDVGIPQRMTELRRSYPIDYNGRIFRSYAQVKLSSEGLIRSFRAGHMDLATGQKTSEVVCETEIFGEEE